MEPESRTRNGTLPAPQMFSLCPLPVPVFPAPVRITITVIFNTTDWFHLFLSLWKWNHIVCVFFHNTTVDFYKACERLSSVYHESYIM